MNDYCERCGEKLKEGNIEWLELSNTTNIWHWHKVPEHEVSQGMFAFGKTCAKRVIENNGRQDW